MVRTWVSWTFALHVVGATAQPVTVDTVRAVQPWPPHELFTFPVVSVPDHPDVAARINRDLCSDFLYVDPDTARGSIFQQVWGDPASGIPQQLFSLSWAVGQPLPQVLSVALSAEGCGAYCEFFSSHYTYDLRTGGRLRYGGLFTQEGGAAVDDVLHAHWLAAVEEQVRVIQDTLRLVDLTDGDRDHWQSSLAMYRQCVEARQGQPDQVADFEFLPNLLRVWMARCSLHADRALDDLDQVAVDLPYDLLEPYLIPEVLVLLHR